MNRPVTPYRTTNPNSAPAAVPRIRNHAMPPRGKRSHPPPRPSAPAHEIVKVDCPWMPQLEDDGSVEFNAVLRQSDGAGFRRLADVDLTLRP